MRYAHPAHRARRSRRLIRAERRHAGTINRVEQPIGLIEDPDARARLNLLLGLLGNPVANFLLGGRLGAFDRLSPDDRLAVLRNWAHSRLALKRAGFQAS